MANNNLIQNTIEKIKRERIAPKPGWKYRLKKYSMWILFLGAIFLAVVSFLAGYDNAHNLDWDLYFFANQSKFYYFFSLVPYFWIILLVIFLSMAFFEMRQTEKGYRYSYFKIFVLIFGSVVLFSAIGLFFSWGNKLNLAVSQNFANYPHGLMMTKERQWMQPEAGFLAGTIVSVSKEKLFIRDLVDNDWQVCLSADTIIKPAVNIKEGEVVKIIGEKEGADNFIAKEIRPWSGMRMMRGSGMHMRQNSK